MRSSSFKKATESPATWSEKGSRGDPSPPLFTLLPKGFISILMVGHNLIENGTTFWGSDVTSHLLLVASRFEKYSISLKDAADCEGFFIDKNYKTFVRR